MQKTILVVDDQKEIRSFLKKTLSAHNFNVIEAGDGTAALKMVESERPDLVVLDFGLPKVPGETVCVEIKKNHPEIIVIALTGKSTTDEIVHGLQIGADDYMTKPFVSEELMARIHTRLKVVPDESKPQSLLSSKPDSTQELQKLKIRESIVLIASRLIVLELLFGILFYGGSLAISFLDSNLHILSVVQLYAILFAVFLAGNALVTLIVVLQWYFRYSEISGDYIVSYSGIFHKTEEKNACNYIETITIEQSFLGMLLNYGTLVLYNPALKQQIYLANIANPKIYMAIIEKSFLKNKKPMTPFGPEIQHPSTA